VTNALFEELREALPADRFIQFDLNPNNLLQVAQVPGLAAGWIAADTHRHTTWLTVHTAQESTEAHTAGLELISMLLDDERGSIGGITVSDELFELLPERYQPLEPSHWHWWYTAQPVTYLEATYSMTMLDPADDRLDRLLVCASPSAPVRPGDPRSLIWAGIIEPDQEDTGGLVAMLTALGMSSGAAHFNDVATHPAHRGRGLARSLCAQATNHLLAAGHPAITLGMYAANESARRVYQALGFTQSGAYSSGIL
jgi:ribosomal protein S18 acetylase RimI-like enzyme